MYKDIAISRPKTFWGELISLTPPAKPYPRYHCKPENEPTLVSLPSAAKILATRMAEIRNSNKDSVLKDQGNDQ